MRRRHPKPDIVVTVIRFVVVAIRTARVPMIVVERTAAQHTALYRPALLPIDSFPILPRIVWGRAFALPQTHAFLKVEKGLKEKTFFGTFGVPIPTKLEEGQLWSLT